MKPVIKVNSISKKYRFGVKQPYYSLRDRLMVLLKDPLKSFRRKRFTKNGLYYDEFWALKDVSFDVSQGEVVGIVGKNGAGKTTLLKILSRVTPPTTGAVHLKGRVASLLEVGTGFHPELTGRENIYLNGAIMGMKRAEINEKFEEIVSFAEVEKFLDTPVKHYSAGMHMRLAFSVAANLDAEILLVDEVLAVGDIAFQKKCLGKMGNISKKGRTVLFVSHNLSAVKKLCSKGILLKEGQSSEMLAIDKLINTYQFEKSQDAKKLTIKLAHEGMEFTGFAINNISFADLPEIFPQNNVSLSFEYYSKKSSFDLCMSVAFRKKEDYTLLVYTHNHLENIRHKTGKHGKIKISFFLPHVAPGNYTLELQIWLDGRLVVDGYEIGNFTIAAIPAFASGQTFVSYPSHLLLRSKWEFN